MLSYDFSPLYRSAVGFDRLARLAESALRHETAAPAYPPYNIERAGEDKYRITLAVAGFSLAELQIEARDNALAVSGKKTPSESEQNYLYKGIAERDFLRKFELADHVKVIGANLDNGLLTIELMREIPEEMKPRTIEIKTGQPLSLTEKAKKLLGKSEDKQAA